MGRAISALSSFPTDAQLLVFALRNLANEEDAAVDSFERILKYPRTIISRNASESFFPKREGIYSQWLLDHNGIYTYCRYYKAVGSLPNLLLNFWGELTPRHCYR